jgi:hypothetical protein
MGSEVNQTDIAKRILQFIRVNNSVGFYFGWI